MYIEKDKRILAKNIYMDKDPYITHKNNNILVVGAPGSQKTLSYVLPNILNTYSESMVIVDVKGDIIKKTAGIMKGRGYDIHCIDFKNFKIGERYNPISLLKDDIDIAKFASLIFKTKSFNADPFWDDMSRLFLTICIHFIKERFPTSEQTFEKIVELSEYVPGTENTKLDSYMNELEHGKTLRYPDGTVIRNRINFTNMNELKSMKEFKGNPKLDVVNNDGELEYMSLIDDKDKSQYSVSKFGNIRKISWQDEFGQNQTINPQSQALSLYKQFATVVPSEKTLASILSSFISQLNLYSTDTVSDFMSKNEIDFTSIGSRKTVLYLIVDDLSSAYNPLIECLIYQLIQCLVKEAENNKENHLSVPVHLYLDDFATYYIPDMERLIASLRSRGIGMSLILQSETQLYSGYGTSAAKTIINSCDTYIYLGGTDIDTAQSIVLRTNNDLKNILELPYGMEYIFQRNEKAVLTDVFPLDEHLMRTLSKEVVYTFNNCSKKDLLGEDNFKAFITDICIEDFNPFEDDLEKTKKQIIH